MRAHEAVIRLLDAEGVSTLFTLMSEDTMRMLSTISTDWSDRISLIKTRHEQGAVAMADGYARSTDGIGVCLVGRGPAIAQTGSAMLTARRRGSNVLVIVPEPRLSGQYDLKQYDQECHIRSTAETVLSIRSHEALVDDFREAIRRTRLGDGPVVVQIPWDILDGEMSPPDNLAEAMATPPGTVENADARLHPNEELVSEAVDIYLDSDAYQPPIILAGRGAVKSDARDALESLAQRTSALLTATLQSRHFFGDHPYYLGFIGSRGSNLANRYTNESQVVFAFGASLNPYTADSGHVFGEETRVIHIDTDPATLGQHTVPDLAILGDARVTAEALVAELEDRNVNRDGELWSESLRNEIANFSVMNDQEFEEIPGTIDPRELILTLDDVLPSNRSVITDGGHFTRWVTDALYTDPEAYVSTTEFASIGLGLPIGIGTALGATDRACVAICGDSGFMMSLPELETAVRNEVPLVVIVWNDSCLGTEYHSLDVAGYSGDVAFVPTPSFAEVAQSLGAKGYTVSDTDELRDLAAVFTGDEPVVIDCQINHLVRHRSKL